MISLDKRLAAAIGGIHRVWLPWLIFSTICLAGCGASPDPEADGAAHGLNVDISFQASAQLYLPGSPPPYPLVIDLHGCSGILPARDNLWFPKFNEAGFAVLQLDSFTRRGVDNICRDLFRVPPLMRSMDVVRAIRWILNDSRFDPNGVFLTGTSHGGTSSLLTQLHAESIFSTLRGVVAFYPYCYDTIPALNSDLLILIGEDDDWTSASRCRDMEILDRAGHSYQLIVYPNAYHSYDVPGLNLVYLGHRLEYNEVATQDSIERVIEFIRERISNDSIQH